MARRDEGSDGWTGAVAALAFSLAAATTWWLLNHFGVEDPVAWWMLMVIGASVLTTPWSLALMGAFIVILLVVVQPILWVVDWWRRPDWRTFDDGGE